MLLQDTHSWRLQEESITYCAFNLTLLENIFLSKTLDTHDTRIRAEQAYLNKLKLQKQGLMQDLLTGKVRVRTIK